MKKIDMLQHYKNLKPQAERNFQSALELKDRLYIGSAIDRLNMIDRDIMREEHQRIAAKHCSDAPLCDWDHIDNMSAELRRQEAIRDFTEKFGKSPEKVLENAKNRRAK